MQRSQLRPQVQPATPALRTGPVEIVSAAILLFLIMDPLGNIPVFLSLLKALPPARRRLGKHRVNAAIAARRRLALTRRAGSFRRRGRSIRILNWRRLA